MPLLRLSVMMRPVAQHRFSSFFVPTDRQSATLPSSGIPF
jgi:hypothetical protein